MRIGIPGFLQNRPKDRSDLDREWIENPVALVGKGDLGETYPVGIPMEPRSLEIERDGGGSLERVAEPFETFRRVDVLESHAAGARETRNAAHFGATEIDRLTSLLLCTGCVCSRDTYATSAVLPRHAVTSSFRPGTAVYRRRRSRLPTAPHVTATQP